MKKILILTCFLISCGGNAKQNVEKRVDPIFEIVDFDFQGKDKAIEDINKIFNLYLVVNQQVNSIEDSKKFYSEAYYSTFNAFYSLASTKDNKALSQYNLTDIYYICQIRHFVAENDLQNKNEHEVLEEFLAASRNLGTQESQLTNLVFIDSTNALGINSSPLGMSSLEFTQENNAWKFNPWGNKLFNNKKEVKLLNESDQTKEDIIKMFCF